MERFIGIALDTIAGEGVDVQDRLIDLSELCAKFAPLLYQVNFSRSSLDDFLQQIHQTWESLKSCNDPLKLVVSNSWLYLLKFIIQINRSHAYLT